MAFACIYLSNKKINQPGKLFVITGHNTFSAATAFLEALETKTACIIVGTQTSDSPIYPAEDNTIVLPNCKMEVRLSCEIWNYSFDEDYRSMIEPDILVATSFKDYSQGKDAVLETIQNYQPEKKAYTINDTETYIGRYQFGIDKTLEITSIEKGLRADIKGRLHTELFPVGENKFETSIKGLILEFSANQLLVYYADGHKKAIKKLAVGELLALDYITSKQYEKASSAYEELKAKYPNDININGTNLAGLAFYLLLETNDFEMSKQMLQIAMRLDPNSIVTKGLYKALDNFNKK